MATSGMGEILAKDINVADRSETDEVCVWPYFYLPTLRQQQQHWRSTSTLDFNFTTVVGSFFAWLQSPCLSELYCKPSCCTDPASVSPTQRVRDFPNKALAVSVGKLFCSACGEEHSRKHSIVRSHLESNKHQHGKQAFAQKETQERDIANALKDYDGQVQPTRETLPEVQSFQSEGGLVLLGSGIPLNILHYFHEVLEEHAYKHQAKIYKTNFLSIIWWHNPIGLIFSSHCLLHDRVED